MKSDIDIARKAQLKPINQIGEELGLKEDDLELYGKYKAKFSDSLMERVKDNEDGKLVPESYGIPVTECKSSPYQEHYILYPLIGKHSRHDYPEQAK